ncbi:MAG TPA: FCD domain-containing protein [Acidimicrobiales bacterium]
MTQSPATASRGTKLSERIARRILHDVTRRGLAPGDMLPSEAKMIAEYGVGRASLREALRILEINGLVTIKPGPGGGPVVGAVEPRGFGRSSTLYLHVLGATVGELVEARAVVEPVMARLAAEEADEAGRRRLRAVLAEGDAVGLDDDDAYHRVANEFHVLLLAPPGNRVLGLYAGALEGLFADRVSGGVLEPPQRRVALDQHRAIGEAVLAGDGDRAEELARHHMVETSEGIRRSHPGILHQRIDWS